MANVTVFFKWISVEADPRNYKPGKPVLEPDMQVAILVPLDHELIYNLEAIATAQMSGEKPPKPILTLKGYAYCIHQLENSLLPEETEDEFEDWSEESDDDEFVPTGE